MLSNESTWLQKALFALQKAEAAREKLADSRGEELDDLVLAIDGKKLVAEEFQEGIENRIRKLLDDVRERRKTLR